MWQILIFLALVLWALGFFVMMYFNIPWLFLIFSVVSILLFKVKQYPRLKWFSTMLALQGMVPFIAVVKRTLGTLNPFLLLLTNWHWPDIIAVPIGIIVILVGSCVLLVVIVGSMISAAVVIAGENP